MNFLSLNIFDYFELDVTTTLSLIAGSITLLSFIIVLSVYLHKKSKRANIWETSTNIQSIITNSAPISR